MDDRRCRTLGRRWAWKISVLLFCSLAHAGMWSCSGPDLPLPEALQRALDTQRERYGARGLSAAVVVQGVTTWVGTSGLSHDSAPVTPDMMFAIGSVTKNVMAALALSLCEDGVLSLDDPVGKWLPPHPHVDAPITIRQLLSHTSGVYQFFSNPMVWEELKRDRARRWTAEEVLASIKEPYFKPGGGFRYSNTNYTLLGMIIEKATGERISTLLRQRFWQPLGIEDAFDFVEEEAPGPLAHVWGTLEEGETERDLTSVPRMAHESIIHPSGGIFMTAEALARWSGALFEGKAISRQSLEEMMRFAETPRNHLPDTQGYGLGLQSFRGSLVAGERAFGHSGGSIGTIAYMVHLPEHHASIAVMINSYNGKCIGRTVREIVRIVSRQCPPRQGLRGDLPS